MDSSPSLERDMPAFESETSSLVYLLESGLHYIQQGRFAEGLTLFALVRENLPASQAHLAIVLDVLIQSQEAYTLAQEELLQASKHFAGADAERRKQLNALASHVTTMQGKTDRISLNGNGHLPNVRNNQSSDASQLQSINFDKKLWPTQLSPRNLEDNRDNQSSSPLPSEESPTLSPLYMTCFGRFEVKRSGKPVVLCPNRAGQTILRYLVAQSEHCATSDTLMALLWPEDELELAQPRLHTAICALRRSLNHGYTCESGGGYIVCKNRNYCFNTAISIQTDVDQFLHYYQAGRQAKEERAVLYEKACRLYTGSFLPEDKYADWSFLQREHLSRVYIDMCRTVTNHYLEVKSYEDAEKWASAILKENRCDELAHRQLIQIYAAQGHRSEALQQYQRCEHILHEELAIEPLSKTVQIVQMMLKSDPSSDDEAEI